MRARGQLFDKWPEWELGAERRAASQRRLDLYLGTYAPRVRAMVRDRVDDPVARDEIGKAVNTAHGLVGAVADSVAVAYQRGCRRELRGASPEAARAFAGVVTESGIVERATSLSAIAWATGPAILAPYVAAVRGVPRLLLHVMLAGSYEVRRSDAAPDVLEAVLWEREDGAFVELDAEGWRYWSADGEPLNGGAVTPHGLAYAPAAVLRARPWLAFDWHNATDHAGLCDAALEVSFRHALALYLRQQTVVSQLVIEAPVRAIPGEQALGGVLPLWINTAAVEPGQPPVKFHTIERKVNVAECLAEIGAIVNAAVARYGIPPSEVSFENSNANWGWAVAVRGERLAAQRDAQAPWLKSSEVALWPVVADVVRASTHRLARVLPAADEVADSLRVAFPDLAAPAEQVARLDAFERAQKHGLANAVDLLLQARPELDRREAEEEIAANLADYATRLEWLASRNVSTDPERGVESIAQLQGREGGRASGEVRREAAAAEVA